MNDREKVIKGLGRVSNDIVDGYITEPDMACNTINDAIDLLKKQEPKPPVVKENSYGWKFYYCPSCGKEFYQNNKFSF